MDCIAGDVLRNEEVCQPEELFDLWLENEAEFSEPKCGIVSGHCEDQEAGEGEIPAHNGAHLKRGEESLPYASGSNEYIPRRTPSFLFQMMMFAGRGLVQQSRDLLGILLDFALVFLGGVFLGLVFHGNEYQGPLPDATLQQCPFFYDNALLKSFIDRPVNDPIASQASLTCLAVSLTGVTAAVRVFGNEKVNYWREASSGMSPLSYFLGKNLAYLPSIVLAPFVYLCVFYTLTAPKGSVFSFYLVLLLVEFVAVGIAFFVSVLLPVQLAYLGGVILCLIMSMFGGTYPTLSDLNTLFPPLKWMPNISYLRWAQEAFYIVQVRGWADVYNINRGLEIFSYHLDEYSLAMGLLLVFGVIFRLAAYLVMVLMNRDKQK